MTIIPYGIGRGHIHFIVSGDARKLFPSWAEIAPQPDSGSGLYDVLLPTAEEHQAVAARLLGADSASIKQSRELAQQSGPEGPRR